MSVKTRERLIEVARQLFAHKGMENTTMIDIANASYKGRRTIYTYFKNKREIYNAVIESESEQLVKQLRYIASADMTPIEKLEKFIDVRIDIVEETVSRQYDTPMFRTLFLREVRRMERIRKAAIEKELELLQQILSDGIKGGYFVADKAHGVYDMMLMLFQGIELSYMRDNFDQMNVDQTLLRKHAKQFIADALCTNNCKDIKDSDIAN
ncbi:MAG: TetR/AcrR family transcriptional regulator [Muribaculum sp.]|nr:TetR/AcrR family transcriptional regulator [Muribaculaceae bacterium]MCM1081038.1 TetR/AcrR family transcriptional regulator [Muribaculum sp.]